MKRVAISCDVKELRTSFGILAANKIHLCRSYVQEVSIANKSLGWDVSRDAMLSAYFFISIMA